jgi:hypothetical protein
VRVSDAAEGKKDDGRVAKRNLDLRVCGFDGAASLGNEKVQYVRDMDILLLTLSLMSISA